MHLACTDWGFQWAEKKPLNQVERDHHHSYSWKQSISSKRKKKTTVDHSLVEWDAFNIRECTWDPQQNYRVQSYWKNPTTEITFLTRNIERKWVVWIRPTRLYMIPALTWHSCMWSKAHLFCFGFWEFATVPWHKKRTQMVKENSIDWSNRGYWLRW